VVFVTAILGEDMCVNRSVEVMMKCGGATVNACVLSF